MSISFENNHHWDRFFESQCWKDLSTLYHFVMRGPNPKPFQHILCFASNHRPTLHIMVTNFNFTSFFIKMSIFILVLSGFTNVTQIFHLNPQTIMFFILVKIIWLKGNYFCKWYKISENPDLYAVDLKEGTPLLLLRKLAHMCAKNEKIQAEKSYILHYLRQSPNQNTILKGFV